MILTILKLILIVLTCISLSAISSESRAKILQPGKMIASYKL